MLSVNTNTGAMIALQYLNQTQADLAKTQSAINTGLKVSSAKDDGATFAMAQNMRGNVAGYTAVTDSIDRGMSAINVAMSAGQSISDLLVEMKTKALAASDTSLDTTSRQAMNQDFVALARPDIDHRQERGVQRLQSGRRLDPADHRPGVIRRHAPHHGRAQNLSLSGSIVTISTAASISTQAAASTMVTAIQGLADQCGFGAGAVVRRLEEILGSTRLHPETLRYADHRYRKSGRRRYGQGERDAAVPPGQAATRRSGPVDRQPGPAISALAVQIAD